MDMTSMMASQLSDGTAPEGQVNVTEMLGNLFSQVDPNDLASLKTYLDSGESGIEQYANAIEYTYEVSPQIYRLDGDNVRQVNPDRSFTALASAQTRTASCRLS